MEAAHGEPKTEYPDEFYVTENKKRLLIVQLAAGNAIIMEQPCYQKGISIISPVLKHNKVIPLCKSER